MSNKLNFTLELQIYRQLDRRVHWRREEVKQQLFVRDQPKLILLFLMKNIIREEKPVNLFFERSQNISTVPEGTMTSFI